MSRNLVRRFRQMRSLPRRDRWLLVESVVWVLVIRSCLVAASHSSVRDGISFLTARFDFVTSCFNGTIAQTCPRERIPWAIERSTSILPGTYTCLVRALAAEVLLIRRGYPATVQLGVDLSDDDFEAHAWVESEGEVIVGDVERARFTRLK